MGWNEGWTIFEATVVGAYDLGKLDKDLLAVLMEPYRDTDIDAGGKTGLLAKDGKGAEEIAIEAWGLEVPQRPAEAQLPWKMRDASPEEEANWAAWEKYEDEIYETFRRVTEEFGW